MFFHVCWAWILCKNLRKCRKGRPCLSGGYHSVLVKLVATLHSVLVLFHCRCLLPVVSTPLSSFLDATLCIPVNPFSSSPLHQLIKILSQQFQSKRASSIISICWLYYITLYCVSTMHCWCGFCLLPPLVCLDKTTVAQRDQHSTRNTRHK